MGFVFLFFSFLIYIPIKVNKRKEKERSGERKRTTVDSFSDGMWWVLLLRCSFFISAGGH